ncbi:MAG: GNAT family N-acetyltransferase, partial [Microbacterium sp.]|uniref:GNAT family N-acetyltransferase n=1 Tax=Microbacterium sp. TaxID=51671 RepID=UPI0039E5336E
FCEFFLVDDLPGHGINHLVVNNDIGRVSHGHLLTDQAGPSHTIIQTVPRRQALSVLMVIVGGMSAKLSRKTATSKKHRLDAARRQARVAYLADHRAAPTGRFWHGGRPGLAPGTILMSRNEADHAGADMGFYEAQPGYEENFTHADRVYFSSDRAFARAYAGLIQQREERTGVICRQGDLYEVEPVGEIEKDPDFSGGVSWCAPQARIVAVAEVDVRMSAYDVTERLGPRSYWLDGSPVYTADGRYLPSPEQLASAGTLAALAAESLIPWTPVEFINAFLRGRPTGDRPSPAQFPDVMVGAAEPVPVMQRQRARAKALFHDGVEFTQGADASARRINELLRSAGDAVVRGDDSRTVITAAHPQAGIIGAALVTSARLGEQYAMFIDAVAVAPEWQRRGIGSTLLLSAGSLFPAPVSYSGGHCDPSVAGFFAHIGFTVLRPGGGLIVPLDDRPRVHPVCADHCAFYRQGPV